jgi:hypothetical protein
MNQQDYTSELGIFKLCMQMRADQGGPISLKGRTEGGGYRPSKYFSSGPA